MKKLTYCSILTASLLAFCSNSLAQSYVYLPTNVAGAGMSYIVPDTYIWYGYTNHVTVGPVNIGDQLGNNGNWEPYCGSLGDSAFLLGFCSYALDGSATPASTPSDQFASGQGPLGRQQYYVTIVPANGSTPRTVSAIYDDYGHAFTNEISVRQNGNPFHVTGDKRYGGTNYMVGGEASPNEWNGSSATAINFFNSDGRWNQPIWAAKGMAATTGQDSPNGDNANRYAIAQNFGIDPNNWANGPFVLGKTLDVALSSQTNLWGNAASTGQQYGRWGGDLVCLSDGNFACAVEDRTGIWPEGGGTVSIAAIIRPNGTFVKPSWFVAPKNFWTGVAAFKGGFCIRVGSFNQTDWDSGNYPNVLVPPSGADSLLFFYDNGGNCYATNAMVASSGQAFSNAGSRGDGTGFASDVRSHYVYYTDKVPGNSGDAVVAIWDGRTGAFVTNATWTTTDPSLHSLDRFGIGVDALDRFCVAVDMRFDQNFSSCYFQDVARVGQFDGTNITWLTPMFFPFINHETNVDNLLGIETGVCPYVMMNTKEICICAKAFANSTNNPDGGPDTYSWACNGQGFCPPGNPKIDTGANDRSFIYTILTHPAPVDPPKPRITLTKSGNNTIISYPWDAGLFRLQHKTTSLGSAGGWTDVSPQPPLQVQGTDQEPVAFYFTVPLSSGTEFFRLTR